ncbi:MULTISPECIES: ABC transporter substrate-binding protein [unclassified Enterococcus]|uniref:ABC transporter substrate-binding protein n=1 Tax=unclassified Enterococcus TaxID=2608891 RepID=UPI00155225C0|nr:MULTISPECIES: ABC transporter substrate-binding protein [unclassified Enterococcus]MBS7576447.1 ABC transporter substrate-binding protein [Enterococcus sp. MMGLQ5-2]MBS7583679.1 ABC transporter substrate-binding protein [Enterococcus sp. MMGLQ5-1]NPD11540.1 ABC transporter substrate-binding protein [Enterococcus sp. MMGLQ5-1]NPD36284.1 ABC transporter substrate-binding protein [Enterococcus sp. MMGLQ5-2]
MKKMFKNFSILLFSFIVVVGLVGCGSKNSDSDSSDKKTLTVGFWKGDSTTEDTARKNAFAAFTKKTGIKIKEKVYNDYDTQLMTDFVGGTAPDVFYVDSSSIPTFYEQGVLEPLDSYIEKQKDFNASDFYEPIYNAFKGSDGKMYGVPKDYSTLGLYYNEDLLAKAGMTAADLPKDYSEMEAFLTKLKEKLPDVQPMVFSALLARQVYIAQSEGGSIVDSKGNATLDDAKVVSALQVLVDLYQKGLIRTASDLGDGWAGDTFGRGGAVISDEGTWMVSHLNNNFSDLKWGVTELPTVNNQQGNMAYAVSYSMNSASKNKDEAWDLINYLTHDAMADYAKAASVLPSRKSVAEAIDINANETMSPFIKAADYATAWQDGPYLSLISSRYDNMITSALKGEMTLEAALKEATVSANQDIENQIK